MIGFSGGVGDAFVAGLVVGVIVGWVAGLRLGRGDR